MSIETCHGFWCPDCKRSTISVIRPVHHCCRCGREELTGWRAWKSRQGGRPQPRLRAEKENHHWMRRYLKTQMLMLDEQQASLVDVLSLSVATTTTGSPATLVSG